MNISRLTVVVSTALLSTFALAAGPSSRDGALLITQLDSQHWQLRLMQGTDGQRFNGLIESNSPFASVSGLQSQASTKLWSPTTLGADLTFGPGGTNQLDFSASA